MQGLAAVDCKQCLVGKQVVLPFAAQDETLGGSSSLLARISRDWNEPGKEPGRVWGLATTGRPPVPKRQAQEVGLREEQANI